MDKDSANCYWIKQISESISNLSEMVDECINYGHARRSDLFEMDNELRVINIYLTALGINEQTED